MGENHFDPTVYIVQDDLGMGEENNNRNGLYNSDQIPCKWNPQIHSYGYRRPPPPLAGGKCAPGW